MTGILVAYSLKRFNVPCSCPAHLGSYHLSSTTHLISFFFFLFNLKEKMMPGTAEGCKREDTKYMRANGDIREFMC